MDRKLQTLFGNDKSLFLAFCRDTPDYSIQFGFDVPNDLWNANPEVCFVI